MTALVVKMPAQTIGDGGGVQERRQLRQEINQQQAEHYKGAEE